MPVTQHVIHRPSVTLNFPVGNMAEVFDGNLPVHCYLTVIEASLEYLEESNKSNSVCCGYCTLKTKNVKNRNSAASIKQLASVTGIGVLSPTQNTVPACQTVGVVAALLCPAVTKYLMR